MDFFSHQDQARKRTKQLVLLFSLSIVVLILLTNILVAAAMWGFDGFATGQGAVLDGNFWQNLLYYLNSENFITITLSICLFVFTAAFFKWLQLKGGGHYIAESLNGQMINTDTDDFYQRRLLNIVEEMALASSMPVPAVYLLKNEIGINAFAAGYQTSDAVLGITQGAIEKLSRKQLQGVIGHEFSHILNGDMRLNIRLIAILHGILCISYLGRFMVEASGHSRYNSHRRSSVSKDSMPFIVAGLGFIVIGYVGVFFGNLIKAAVSRQREFLADASAVQFTRDPSAISEALQVIGYKGIGSSIGHSKREEMSHLFFGSALFFSLKMFATHPPVDQRIQRIDKNWSGEFLAPLTRQHIAEEKAQVEKARNPDILSGVAAAVAASINFPGKTAATSTSQTVTGGQASTDLNKQQQVAIAEQQLQQGCHQSYSAQAILYASLMADADSLIHIKQLDLILNNHDQATLSEVKKWHKVLTLCNKHQYLPLIEVCIPSLKAISKSQFEVFQVTLTELVKADGKIDIFEWCLYRLTLQYLSPQFINVKPIKAKYGKVAALKEEIQCILSFVAQHGHDEPKQAEQSFQHGAVLADIEHIQLQDKIESFKQFNQAIKKLTQAYPHVKGRVLKALAGCVKNMGTRPLERDLVVTIAALLETPVPDLFDD